MIKDVDESFEKYDSVLVDFEALAGTTPGQVGRTHLEFFSTKEKALPRLQRLALAVGLLKPDEPEKEVQFSDAIGRQLVIEIEENTYEKDGKTHECVRIAFLGMWSSGNKAVADVPKDAESLKLAQGGAGATTDGGKANPAEGKTAEAATAAGTETSQDDAYADL